MIVKKGHLLALTLLAAAKLCAAEKPQTWIEVRSPHFEVMTNTNAKQGRRTADQFEQMRAVFQTLLPKARLDPGVPFIILAVKDEKSLRELIPAYWEKKGLLHPAGMFVSGEDKDYVALRTDVEGDTPYEVLYHEYVHLVVRLNFERIPVWLNEGLAEFYGNMKIGEKEVTLGNYSVSHLQQLGQSKLLPLDVFFQADEHSPYYHEENKATVFYAESWALVHYLMLGDNGVHVEQLGRYLDLIVQKKMESLEAARSAFGDLQQLFKALSGYSRQEGFGFYHMKSPAELKDQDFPTREVPQAEALTVRGDFYAHTERPIEARAMLEQAQALDPRLAPVYESFGLLALRERNLAQATESFAHAAELDSHSFLAQYFGAMATMQHEASSEGLAKAEAGFKRAIELNPRFAAAYSSLAHIYLMRGENLEKALELAQAAASLEPGAIAYRLNMGYVLMRMGKTAEALAIGQRILAQATSDGDRLSAQSFVNQVESFSRFEQARAARQQAASEDRGDAGSTDFAGDKITLRHRPSKPAAPLDGPRSHASGRITAVNCDGYALDLTLATSGGTLNLHTENYYHLDLEALNWEPPVNFNPCKDLAGRDARVVYVAAAAEKDSGVLLTVEVQGGGKK